MKKILIASLAVALLVGGIAFSFAPSTAQAALRVDSDGGRVCTEWAWYVTGDGMVYLRCVHYSTSGMN